MTEPIQPEPQFVIAALQEELAAAQENRHYLLAIIKQMGAEYNEAKVLWELERESLKMSMKGSDEESTD